MRTMLFAILVTVGVGLVGMSGASSASLGGVVLRNAADVVDTVKQAAAKSRNCHDRRRSRIVRC